MRILSRYVFREDPDKRAVRCFAGDFYCVSPESWEAAAGVHCSDFHGSPSGGEAFFLALPQVLPLTIPFGVLVGILIGLGRMASDGEITAMRAGGISSRTVTPPVLVFCLFAELPLLPLLLCGLRRYPSAPIFGNSESSGCGGGNRRSAATHLLQKIFRRKFCM